ncbi:hypothetical protein [Algoriphagus mannitolivorans]|uniref:hypothetical protein n=1 Tax=Algoriphagus mannitolivorans TaxID=226504 RepID=UPI000687515C|nr:hypothetical protein [Algoriphagus mannitolivorans]
MKLFSIALLGLGLLAGTNKETPRTDIKALEVKEYRTSMNGVYYSYKITNSGTTTIAADSYKLDFKVNGKVISFDRDTQELKPGQSVLYKSQKTTYPKKGKDLTYVLDIKFDDDDLSNNQLKGITAF